MVLVALAWIPVIKGAQGLYSYLQAVQGYLAPPIFVVFFLRRVLEAAERAGRALGDDRGLRAGHFPHDGGYAGDARPGGFQNGYPDGIVPLDRQ